MSNVPTMQELLAVIASLQADLAAKNAGGVLSLALSKPKLAKDGSVLEPTKGAVSMYGVNSTFPVTHYANQWERIMATEMVAKVIDFIKVNDAVLNRKGRPFVTDPATGLAVPYKG